MKILVTGAGGFVGRALVEHLLAQGYGVVALVRRNESIFHAHPNLKWQVGDIRDVAFLRACAAGADVVVHLAALKSDEKESYETNVSGTRTVVAAAESAGMRGIIYVSTVSAKFSRRGAYGETKRAADEIILSAKIPSLVLTSSIIYGEPSEGIFGMLTRFGRLGIIPIFGTGAQPYWPILADDVALAIEKIISRGLAGQRQYDLGGPERLTFNELARAAGNYCGKKVRLIHLPHFIGMMAARFFSLFMRRPPITVSNMLGMSQAAEIDTEPFFKEYDFHPHSLEGGLTAMKEIEARRKSEPSVLLRYILPGARIPDELAGEFEKALERYGLSKPLDSRILKSPLRLGALDGATRFLRREGNIQRKLGLAAALAECSPLSAQRLLPKERARAALMAELCLAGLRAAAKLALGVPMFIFFSKRYEI